MLYRPSKLEQPGKSISWLNIDIVSQACGPEVFFNFNPKKTGDFKGGFHLYLLVFPFVYQFYSRIEALVSSSFAND